MGDAAYIIGLIFFSPSVRFTPRHSKGFRHGHHRGVHRCRAHRLPVFFGRSAGKVLVMQMIHDYFGWLQLAVFMGLLLVLTRPTGAYLLRVLDGNGRTFLDPVLRPVERAQFSPGSGPREGAGLETVRGLHAGLQPGGLLFTYSILRLQHLLPLNPQGLGAVPPISPSTPP